MAAFNKDVLASHLNQWKLLPRPERFTELYFTASHLPVSFKPGQQQQVVFVVHNLEHRTTSYRYQIIAQAPQGRQVLDEGTVRLGHDESREMSRAIVIPLKEPRVAVRVSLTYSGIPRGEDSARSEIQSIYYWAYLAH